MSTIIKVFKGCFISSALFIVLLLFAAVALALTSIPSTVSPIISMGILAVSCACMGLFAGNVFSKRGLLTGALAAFLFELLIITMIMLIFSVKIADYSLEIKHLVPVIAGAIGGTVGIGMKK